MRLTQIQSRLVTPLHSSSSFTNWPPNAETPASVRPLSLWLLWLNQWWLVIVRPVFDSCVYGCDWLSQWHMDGRLVFVRSVYDCDWPAKSMMDEWPVSVHPLCLWLRLAESVMDECPIFLLLLLLVQKIVPTLGGGPVEQAITASPACRPSSLRNVWLGPKFHLTLFIFIFFLAQQDFDLPNG